jgi:hypothetical protein
MRKLLVFFTGLMLFLFLQQAYAQTPKDTAWMQDFDGSLPPTGWSVPFGTWLPNTLLSVSGQSYHGLVPNKTGDSAVLITDYYNCNDYPYVYLRFSHICKVSPDDKVTIEYQESGSSRWTPIPNSAYRGSATNYGTTGFNAASYGVWTANNNAAVPQNSWWQEELFNLQQEIGSGTARFRLTIKRGNVAGTQFAYGWLLENFEVLASINPIILPTVQFVSPFAKDTVYNTGPWVINAKVKTNSTAPIVPPWLVWTTSAGLKDSVLMTMVAGDSLWRATIPQYVAGTKVTYYVIGKDTFGNEGIANAWYYIKLSCGSGGISPVNDFLYTGGVQMALLPPGIYELECWGGDGGGLAPSNVGGKGGYSKGSITLTTTTTIYVYVGEGNRVDGASRTKTFGGGGYGYSTTATRGAGGGASDIRVLADDLYNRIIVGGGGGGSLTNSTTGNPTTAHGGGLAGGPAAAATGGSQTAGGISSSYPAVANAQGVFGIGGDGDGGASLTLCGGGGGWYGGGGGNNGAGGSGYVLTPTSHKPVGYFAQNANYYLNNAVTIRVNEPNFVANPETTGHGFVRITATTIFGSCLDYSVAMHSIDMPKDTIPASPTNKTNIVVTVKNAGILDLDSATISFAVNGQWQKDTVVKFVPPLHWDYTQQFTIGSYLFSAGVFDDLCVWVKMPNNHYDSTTFDDTLCKKIYGESDLFAKFTNIPADTVYTTGPHDIEVSITSKTNQLPASVTLNVSYIEHEMLSTTKYHNLSMTSQGGGKWTTEIPNIRYESDVWYDISMLDVLGNTIHLQDSFYITRPECEEREEEPSNSGPSNAPGPPITYSYTGIEEILSLNRGVYEIECWGANGGDNAVLGGKGGYSKGTYTIKTKTTIYISVGGTTTTTAGGWNGGGNAGTGTTAGNLGGGGATHIATVPGLLNTLSAGNSNIKIVAGGGGGAAYDLCGTTNPFTYGHGGGIAGATGVNHSTAARIGIGGTQTAGGIAGYRATPSVPATPGSFGLGGNGESIASGAGGSGGGGGWYGGGGGHYGSSDGSSGGGGSGYIGSVEITNGITAQLTETGFVANPSPLANGTGFVRITPISGSIGGGGRVCLDNSAEMVSIDIADTIPVSPGVYTPIKVTIRNKGEIDLGSAVLSYAINGTKIKDTTISFNPAIPEDFITQVQIGTYLQSASNTDEIIAWVKLPNNAYDTVTYDDTATIEVYGRCDIAAAFTDGPANGDTV